VNTAHLLAVLVDMCRQRAVRFLGSGLTRRPTVGAVGVR
jgi:hypothetical protein